MRDWIEYLAVRGLLGVLASLPFGIAHRLAWGVFRLLDKAVPKLRRAGLRNLRQAYPAWSDRQRAGLLDAMYGHLARLLTVFARLPGIHRGNVERWIRYEGLEQFASAIRQGKGVLFFTAHLGNWELSAYAHALLAEPMDIVVRPLDNPKLDALATKVRTASGNRIIGKHDFARGILRALAANRAVGILADQNASPGEGVFVDFFGAKACAHSGVARLAARSKAPVIPGYALWSEREQRYVLRFYPPVAMSGDVAEDTQRLQRHLEGVIREHPEQWLWIHRRWKTRPPGEPPFYD